MSTNKQNLIIVLKELVSRLDTRSKIANSFSHGHHSEHGIQAENWKGRAYAYKEAMHMLEQQLTSLGEIEDDSDAVPRRSGIRLRR